MSLTIAQLRLAPIMEMRARELEQAFPGLVQFVSGLRTPFEQAHAMAINHLLSPKRFLVSQYIHASEFLEALRLQPDADTVDEVTEVFHQLLEQRPDLVKSPHLTGHAVDPRRMEDQNGTPTPTGQQVIEWIRACPDTVDFRTREGGLRRWHWAVRASVTVTSQL